MTFGDPIIYYCPSCSKPMKMTTYRSYSVFRSDVYSDGLTTGGPLFIPDLAKCPDCKVLFFRHNVKNKKNMEYRKAAKIKDIKIPKRADLINAQKQGVAKNWKEELQLLEDLWRDLNDDLRHGNNNLKDKEFQYWNEICAALLPLAEKHYKEMCRQSLRLKKNSKKYDDKDRDNCLIMTAEINRNLSDFDKCEELINTLNSQWDWLKEQYILEVMRKNPLTFQLLTKSDLNLENYERAGMYDYLDRAKKYKNRCLPEKALADYNKAEELGDGDNYHLYIERALLYTGYFNDHDSAIADFSKALSIAQNSLEEEKKKEKPLNIECYTNWILNALERRSNEYELNGNPACASADKNIMIKIQEKLYNE